MKINPEFERRLTPAERYEIAREMRAFRREWWNGFFYGVGAAVAFGSIGAIIISYFHG